MPHVNIKHFPPLTKVQQEKLVLNLTKVITDVIQCGAGSVSIALESIEKDDWKEKVYVPEILNRKEFLHKFPDYKV